MAHQTNKENDVRVAIAEVLSSTITSVIAQTTNHDEVNLALKPRFGSFLTIESTDSNLRIFAVVFNVIAGATDSVHKPLAMGMTRDQLRIEQPHIFSLLRTEVHAAIVGYETHATMFQHLPPHPPDVHDFVYLSSVEQIFELTRSFDFLRLLLHINSVPADELLAATIREAQQSTGQPAEFLVAAGQSLCQLLQNDYDRLLSILRKIRPQ